MSKKKYQEGKAKTRSGNTEGHKDNSKNQDNHPKHRKHHKRREKRHTVHVGDLPLKHLPSLSSSTDDTNQPKSSSRSVDESDNTTASPITEASILEELINGVNFDELNLTLLEDNPTEKKEISPREEIVKLQKPVEKLGGKLAQRNREQNKQGQQRAEETEEERKLQDESNRFSSFKALRVSADIQKNKEMLKLNKDKFRIIIDKDELNRVTVRQLELMEKLNINEPAKAYGNIKENNTQKRKKGVELLNRFVNADQELQEEYGRTLSERKTLEKRIPSLINQYKKESADFDEKHKHIDFIIDYLEKWGGKILNAENEVANPRRSNRDSGSFILARVFSLSKVEKDKEAYPPEKRRTAKQHKDFIEGYIKDHAEQLGDFITVDACNSYLESMVEYQQKIEVERKSPEKHQRFSTRVDSDHNKSSSPPADRPRIGGGPKGKIQTGMVGTKSVPNMGVAAGERGLEEILSSSRREGQPSYREMSQPIQPPKARRRLFAEDPKKTVDVQKDKPTINTGPKEIKWAEKEREKNGHKKTGGKERPHSERYRQGIRLSQGGEIGVDNSKRGDSYERL